MTEPGTPSVGATATGAASTMTMAGPADAGAYQIAVISLTVDSETVTPPAGWTQRVNLAVAAFNGNVPDRGNTQRVLIYSQDTPDTATAVFTKTVTSSGAAGTRR